MTKSIFAVLATGLVAVGCGAGDELCDPTVPGTICTIAGNGENGYSGDDGPAVDAAMSLPQDMVRASSGDVYILDWNNHRIRRVTPEGTMLHVAGRGELGGGLDDPANSDFNHPTGLLFGPNEETLLIAAWHNSKIRTLDLSTLEIIDTCGDGRRTYFGDGGPAADSSLDLPAAIAFNPEGNLIIMDQANQVIRRINADDDTIERIAGQCVVEPPTGSCSGTDLVQCPGGSGKFTCDISLCGEACTPGYTPDGGDVMAMRMHQTFGQSADPGGRIAYDGAGNLYFSDPGNHIIRRIGTDGSVTTIAGTAPVDGVPQSGYAGDGGPATAAKLNSPIDLGFGDDGTLYFTDVKNHCIRAIDPAGTISTVVGVCGERGYDGDGGPATEALLTLPYGLHYADGMLYIADTGNNVVRSVLLP